MTFRSLAFVGCNCTGDVLDEVSAHDVAWLFDPLLEVTALLADAFYEPQFRGKCISIVTAAVYSDSQPRTFRVYNKNGLSSSLGVPSESCKRLYHDVDWSEITSFQTRCVQLSDYLPLRLSTLIIDAQGADLEILKSIRPWLESGRIGRIEMECDGSIDEPMYDGLPDNSLASAKEFMASFPYDMEMVPGRCEWNPDVRFRVR